jgi:putative glutathione S-transferase
LDLHIAYWQGRLTPTADRATGKRRLVDVYQSQVGSYNGRSTVPMLWDSMENRVVNNESADIIEILNADFNHLARNPGLDLAPPHLKADIDRWNQIIYSNVNNGVYRYLLVFFCVMLLAGFGPSKNPL